MIQRILIGALLLVVAAVADVEADDRPVILISRNAVAPERLEVHLGEVVRWRSPNGEALRIMLDRHHGAHEVAVRSGEIRAVFLTAGEHSYTAALLADGARWFAGVVVVQGRPVPDPLPFTCGPGSFDVICIEP